MNKSSCINLKQPYHLPGYTGFCPQFNSKFGKSFGKTTNRLLCDPTVDHAENLVLSNLDLTFIRPTKNDIDMVNARNDPGDRVYVHPMITGYAGFVPRTNEKFGQGYSVLATVGLAEFERQQAYKRAAREKQIRTNRYQEIKKNPYKPEDNLPFHKTREPKKGRKLPCKIPQAVIQKRKEELEKLRIPRDRERSPYFMPINNPEKYFLKGYGGHIPLNHHFGHPNKYTVNEALCDFTSRYQHPNANSAIDDRCSALSKCHKFSGKEDK